MGEGRKRKKENPLPRQTLFKREDTFRGGSLGRQRKVPLRAHSASTGVPNLLVAAGGLGCSWSPPRVPPVGAGGRALHCRCESGRGRRLPDSVLPPSSPWRQTPAMAPPSPRSRAAAGAEWPIPSGSDAELADPSQRPAPRGSLVRGAEALGPRSSPLGAACGRGAQGRGRAPAAPRRRRKARLGHGHGRRRVSGGSAGSGGEGLPRPARPRAPSSQRRRALLEQISGGRCAFQARMTPGQFELRTHAWWEEVGAHACPSVGAPFTCTHRGPSTRRPQLCGWPLPRLPPPGPTAANPASRQALTSRMGPCFSSRTIRAPPLPAIFLGGHLQRFRGDFLPAVTKLVTPLTKNTRGITS